jgi:RNA polymerase sigma-70 factor (ECF subfamily)
MILTRPGAGPGTRTVRPNQTGICVSEQTDQSATSSSQPSDGKLVRRAVRGDLKAFDELVRRYQRQANAVAYGLLTNQDDAMEVTQDAFLKAYDRLYTLTKPDRFGPWLMTILRNLSLNRRRSRALRRHQPLESRIDGDPNSGVNRADPSADDPLETLSGQDLNTVIEQAIEELPDMQRQALRLFSIEKLPQKQVAEILDCSVEAVKWNVFTARKKLREKLGRMI